MLLFSACDGHSNGKYITAKNIQDFENCTIINGNLRIFEGFIENVLRSTFSYRNETSKECIQFLNK
jgi:hypothetical protein